MEKVEQLLNAINQIAKADDEDLKEDALRDFPIVDEIIKDVNKFEKKIAKLLRQQKKFYVDKVKNFTMKEDQLTLGALLSYITQDAFAEDVFKDKMGEEAASFLNLTVPKMTKQLMELIDTDVQYEVLSNRTLTWIDEWSGELANLMNITSQSAVTDALKWGIKEGKGIDDIARKLKDLPEFNRARARRTALTEVLTACSVSQNEAYMQSPAVTGKTWKHSGPRKIEPRPAHVALDGKTVGVDEEFYVNGYMAKYPRDTALPPSERVNCHCVLSPDVDESILGLSKEEKEMIRQQAIAKL